MAGGWWKLGAMTAVIGAGVACAWQAQQGLNTTADANPPRLSLGDVAEEPSDTEVALTPIAETSPQDETPDPLAVASVPPEPTTTKPADRKFGATKTPERYRRSSDAKQPFSPNEGKSPKREPVEAPELAPPERIPARPLVIEEDNFRAADDSEPVKPALDERAVDEPAPELMLLGNEPDADPLGESVPADFGPSPDAATGSSDDLSLPAKDATSTESFDPFEEQPAARPTPSNRAATPESNDTETDPFAVPPTQPEKTPKRLQMETEDAAPVAEPVAEDPLANPFPDEPEQLKPKRKPAKSPSDSSSDVPVLVPDGPAPRLEPLTAEPTPSPSRNRRSAVPPASDAPPNLTGRADDHLVGDATVNAASPRGVQEPRLTIEKIAPQKAVLGQELIYKVIIRNVGGSPASQVVVEDRIPKGSRLLGTAPRAEMVDKKLIWKHIGTLPPGEERTISIKVIPEEEGPIGSVAKVSFAAEVSAEIVVTAPQLKLKLSGPETAKLGETVELVFSVTNQGSGEASNVVIRSVIPAGLKHPAGSDLEYTVGKLAAKDTREVRLQLTADKPGRTIHQAVLTADGNQASEAQVAIDIEGEQLLLTRTGQPRVAMGRSATFTNQVTNEGPKVVNRIRVTEAVPEGFEFVSATDNGRYDTGTRTITWSLTSIEPGDQRSVSSTLMAKAVGNHQGEVTATGPLGSTATVTPEITVEGFPSLAVEQLGEDRLVTVGEKVTTKIHLKNRGTGTAQRVGLAVDLPPETRFISAQGPGKHRVEGQRVIFEPVNQLSPQNTALYELLLEATEPGDVRLQMQITAEHLRRPVKHEEAVQIIAEER